MAQASASSAGQPEVVEFEVVEDTPVIAEKDVWEVVEDVSPEVIVEAESPDNTGWTQVKGRWKKKKAKEGKVNLLGTIEPEGFNALRKGEWEVITLYVDSGATETVVGEDSLTSVITKEGEACRRGVKYEVANGVRIANKGEKEFTGTTEEGCQRGIVAQVADVNKALLSVSRLVKSGHRVVFDDHPYIEDKTTGEVMWLTEVGGMYALKMWVQGSF